MTDQAYNLSKLTAHTSMLSPDDLVQCPFDPNHQIRRSRLPYHIRDCKKNNPVAAKTKKKTKACPFNSLHIVPSAEFEHHKTICPDRGIIQRLILQENLGPLPNDIPIINHNIETSENWDDDPAVSQAFILSGPAMIKSPSFIQAQTSQSSSNVRVPSQPPLALQPERLASADRTRNSIGLNPSSLLTAPPGLKSPPNQMASSVVSNAQQLQSSSFNSPGQQFITSGVGEAQSVTPPYPIRFAGVGRGQIAQLIESKSVGARQQQFTAQMRVATASPGFNLDTLQGRSSVPPDNNVSWPALNTPTVSQPAPTAVAKAKAVHDDNGSDDLHKINNVQVNADAVKQKNETENNALKEQKKLKKKLRAIQQLEADLAAGKKLDESQMLKLESKCEIERKLSSLEIN